MTRENKKWHVTKRLQDYDAVSLYPSAMRRMKGYLKGKPKIIPDHKLNMKFLNEQDGYFVKIKINKVGIHRPFPLICIRQDNINQYTNDAVGQFLYCDNIYLEDLIKFQQIEFDIICGYYFNEGFNRKINVVIDKLFRDRLRFKKKGNPVQNTIKLIMNSAYGKTLQKSRDTTNRIFNSTREALKFISRNKNYVKHWEQKCGIYIVTLSKSVDKHFNSCHLGAQVLSMSKRIMNEVFCLADEIDATIYYQDTDSMHIEEQDLPRLEKAFNKTYNRALSGKIMGTFHEDFDGYNGSKGKVYSVESYFLGKKSYVDKLNCTDSDAVGYHIRMKGCSLNSIVSEGNPMETYKKLFEGDSVEFDLGAKFDENKYLEHNIKPSGSGVKFKRSKNFTTTTVKSKTETHQKDLLFTRKVTFGGVCVQS